jgi:hypothetical protein
MTSKEERVILLTIICQLSIIIFGPLSGFSHCCKVKKHSCFIGCGHLVFACFQNVLLFRLPCCTCITGFQGLWHQFPSECLRHLRVISSTGCSRRSWACWIRIPCTVSEAAPAIYVSKQIYIPNNIPLGIGIVIQISLSSPPRVYPCRIIFVRLKRLNCPAGT